MSGTLIRRALLLRYAVVIALVVAAQFYDAWGGHAPSEVIAPQRPAHQQWSGYLGPEAPDAY